VARQRPFRSVAVVVDDGVSPFEFATACEVFGMDRSGEGLPAFDFAVCSPRPGPVRASVGFELTAPHRLDRLATADLVVVPALGVDYEPPPELVDALHDVVSRGARVISFCSGRSSWPAPASSTDGGPPLTGSTPALSPPRSPR
jgi:transcriptional regulator GlxA family with amidase domain